MAETQLHRLLERQLRRLGIDAAAGPPSAGPQWQELLLHVSRVYAEHDQERYLLERSQDLASQEMAALYAKVRADRDLLDARVRERTAELHLSQSRLESLLSLSADWIWEQDEQLRFTYLSDGITAAAGIAPEALLGTRRMADDRFDAPPEELATYEAAIEARRSFRDFTYGQVRPDGVKRFIRISGEPVFDADGRFRGYRGVGRDVTQTAVAEQQVRHMARYDALTGLPNRHHFMTELDRTIARAGRSGEVFAVCFIDLDRFKTINDTLGHDAGDLLLRKMAQRLSQALRGSDLLARLGGDEFVVLLEGGGAPGDLLLVAQRLLTAIAEPVEVMQLSFLVTGSIGIALYPNDGGDAATLLKHADSAMYLAKERGKNNIQFYTSDLTRQAADQLTLEAELRDALQRDALALHYQPKVDIATGTLVGVEALVRWSHPQRGFVSPAEFIPLAEDRGLIVPLGRWVMREACRQIQAWQRAGLQVPPVAVNLSPLQFASDTLVDDLVDAMARHGVAAAMLEVELTESVLMSEPARAAEVLHSLASMGVGIAIDDFGTGYSSLSYLKRFPADKVKLDRSFVKGLPDDRDDVAITQAVIALAHSLGLRVVAEGVETPAQRATLQALGCDEAQGYLLGRPVAAGDLRLLPLNEAAAA